MLSHHEQRKLPYRPEQMFALVAGIERYPDFLPWVAALRVNRTEGDTAWADMMVGYKMVRERFSCKVHFEPDAGKIDVEYLSGPLKHLKTHWHFTEEATGCLVDFQVEFEFARGFFQRLAKLFFDEVIKRMVGAFEAEAHRRFRGSMSDDAVDGVPNQA